MCVCIYVCIFVCVHSLLDIEQYVKYTTVTRHYKQVLRTGIDNLRRERLVFDDIHRKLAKSLLVKKKEMAGVISHTNHILESREKVIIAPPLGGSQFPLGPPICLFNTLPGKCQRMCWLAQRHAAFTPSDAFGCHIVLLPSIFTCALKPG